MIKNALVFCYIFTNGVDIVKATDPAPTEVDNTVNEEAPVIATSEPVPEKVETTVQPEVNAPVENVTPTPAVEAKEEEFCDEIKLAAKAPRNRFWAIVGLSQRRSLLFCTTKIGFMRLYTPGKKTLLMEEFHGFLSEVKEGDANILKRLKPFVRPSPAVASEDAAGKQGENADVAVGTPVPEKSVEKADEEYCDGIKVATKQSPNRFWALLGLTKRMALVFCSTKSGFMRLYNDDKSKLLMEKYFVFLKEKKEPAKIRPQIYTHGDPKALSISFKNFNHGE